MSEELRSDPVAAPKQGWYARLNAWYRQNKFFYLACSVFFSVALTFFGSGIYDQVIRATLGTALLFGAGAALVIGAAAAMIWAILTGRNVLTLVAALAVGASSSLLFFVFAPTTAYASNISKDLVVLRLIFAAPALAAGIALLIQALPKRHWWLVVIATTIALIASATLYLAFAQYQSFVNGDSAEVYEFKATKYVEAKQYDAAIVVYSDAIRLQPYQIIYYDDQARAYEAKGDYDSAIAVYNTYIGIESSDIPDNYLIGSTYKDVGSAYSTTLRYSQAITAYSQSISYVPTDVDSYISRGDIYLKLGQKDKAIADYQAALACGGVDTMSGSDGTCWSYSTPADRSRIEQKLKDLGVVPPVAIPSPTSHP